MNHVTTAFRGEVSAIKVPSPIPVILSAAKDHVICNDFKD